MIDTNRQIGYGNELETAAFNLRACTLKKRHWLRMSSYQKNKMILG